MLDYGLLDKYRFGATAVERNESLQDLIAIELQGKAPEGELLDLFADNDFYLQSYAMGALSRAKSKKAIPLFIDVYKHSNNPILLQELLEAFIEYGTQEFGPIVMKRLKSSPKPDRRNNTAMEHMFDHEFILDQILLGSLKYFLISGFPKALKVVKKLIYHPDPNIRYHCLLVYQGLEKRVKKNILLELQADPDPRIQTLAKQMNQNDYE